MKVQGIIIDMDGTLTKFNLDYKAARRRALTELERLGLRTPEMNEEISLFVLIDRLRERLKPEIFLKVRATLYGFFEEMELKAAQDAVLFPGAVETLRILRSMSLKLGIATNNGRAGTDITLKRLGLQGFFDAIVTRDDCEEMKPAGEPILKILAELSVPPEAAILVGDGVIDVLAAKAAGIRSAAVTPSPFPIERVLNAEPDYLLGSVNDTPLLLKELDP